MITYVILEWTPFPGRWTPMYIYQLQEAEDQLKLNLAGYHTRALQVGRYLLYSYEDASAIVDYWQKKQDYAQYQLWGHVSQRVKQ
jgi:hypothetical protein